MPIAAGTALGSVVAPLDVGGVVIGGATVAGIAAVRADQQPLKQVAGAARLAAGATPVLFQLFGRGGEQIGIDQCRHRDDDPFLRRRGVDGAGPTRLGRAGARRTQTWPRRSGPTLAELGLAHVGAIGQQGPDRRAVPLRFARRTRNLPGFQAPARFAQRAAFQPDPSENLYDDACRFVVDLVARLAVAFVLAEIMVTIGSAA